MVSAKPDVSIAVDYDGEPPDRAHYAQGSRGEGKSAVDGSTTWMVCPDGVEGGDTIQVAIDGQELEMVVPAGISHGDEFEVRHSAEQRNFPSQVKERTEEEEVGPLSNGSSVLTHYRGTYEISQCAYVIDLNRATCTGGDGNKLQ
jgi:hypothetical protein